MLIVFGAILQHIRTFSGEEAASATNTSFPKNYEVSIGGKGALQAVAAARCGAKTHLVGQTGDDELSKHILLRLRTHGVITSGVAKVEHAHTGTEIYIHDEGRIITALGASRRTSADQVPASILNDQTLILAQTELDMEQTAALLESAKDKNATTILNAAPRVKIEKTILEYVNILIVHEDHEDAVPAVDSYEHLTLITFGQSGCKIRLPGGKTSTLNTPEIPNTPWKNDEGTEDAFCGTLAAGLYAKMPLPAAAHMALTAAALTANKKGAYDALPYIGDIHKALNKDE